jgi:hypothetical protein
VGCSSISTVGVDVAMFTPLANPDVGAAAHALVQGLQQFTQIDDRVGLLNDINQCLGETWHPFYVKLLMVVGESAPVAAQNLVADSMAHAMQRGQSPGGALNAWGVPTQLAAVVGQLGEGFLRMAVRRTLDPIAYACAWYSQSTSRNPLSQDIFERTISALISLFASSPWATSVYQSKLLADAANSTEGTFTDLTRLRLSALVSLWKQGLAPSQIAAQVARTHLELSSMAVAVRAWRPLS